MLAKPIDDVTLADLQALVDHNIPESRRLEFKRDHYGRKDDDRREFAADVSAMANAQGGDLIIGIAEQDGAASQLVGVATADSDGLIRAITESLRNSIEPPIQELRVVWIENSPGKGLIVVRVPRSWRAPHRVTVARDNRFFVRDENGKHPMSVDELRHAFLFGTEIESRVRSFRTERLKLLMANEGPLAIATDKPRMIAHVVPLAAITDPPQIEFKERRAGICPLGARGANSTFSIDGLVTYSGLDERFEAVHAFTTFFRSGIIEAVGTVYAGERNGRRSLSLAGLEEEVAWFLPQCAREYEHYMIGPPVYFMLSIVGVRGLSAYVDDRFWDLAFPHRSDTVLLPELRLEAAELIGDPDDVLRPVFDLLWNAFGQRGSPRTGARRT